MKGWWNSQDSNLGHYSSSHLSYCSVNKSPEPGGGPGLSIHKYIPLSERIYRKPDVCHRIRRACVILGAHSTRG